MPKERRDRSVSFDRSQASPFPCSSSHARQSIIKKTPNKEDLKEWEEARCPVCMEHPHNAVLLMCSSHKNGCRPYMCDTSYRHSNCLDLFRKSFSETPKEENTIPQVENTTEEQVDETVSEEQVDETVSEEQVEEIISDMQTERSGDGSSSAQPILLDTEEKLKLLCPLCRGEVSGWTIMDPARTFMNGKSRSCASETCDFCGTYADLRKHARQQHPLTRPSVADPDRERNWRRLERQRDFGDLISTLQSLGEDRSSTEEMSIEEGGWLTVFFLIRVFRPENGSSRSSSSWPGGSSRARVTRRSTRLWGETHDAGNTEAATGERDNNDEGSDGGNVSRRTRRRLRRQSTPNEEQ